MKRLVIIGAGAGGVMLGNRMRRKFKEKDLEIVIIEPKDYHVYQPAFTLVAFDLANPNKLTKPVKDILSPGIHWVHDKATEIIASENKVMTENCGDFPYDYLVIATGATYTYDEPDGVEEALKDDPRVHTFYTLEGSWKIRDALKDMHSGTIVTTILSMPIKCPAAPIKFIMMAEDYKRNYHFINTGHSYEQINRDNFDFILTTPMPATFSREPYAGKMREWFKERDIQEHSGFDVSEIDYEKQTVSDFTGRTIRYDLLCVIPSHSGQPLIENSEDIGDFDNWVTCDKHLMNHTKFENIFAIGDASDFPTSKTASGIRKQAKVLAKRLTAIIQGKTPPEKAQYDGEIICPILTKYGEVMLAHFNYDKSLSKAKATFFAWAIKVELLQRLYWHAMLPGYM